MKTPVIYSVDADGKNLPIFSQGDYDVFIGALEDDKLPMYVLVNRNTQVVEFTTEVTPIYKEWLDHFAPQTQVESALTASEQLSLALKN